MQETLLSAWRGLSGFEERASVRTWLYRVATNCCLKLQRSRRRSQSVGRPRPWPELRTSGGSMWVNTEVRNTKSNESSG
jgi:DNA-directed RNA polymerase specialized sigma24 family protein